MITKIVLENFQIHKQTEMEFSPGVNLITGQSDNGKSSVIRGLRWAIQNRPGGTSMLRKNAEEPTAARVFFDSGAVVARVRSGKENYYMRRKDKDDPGSEKFQALRTDVPTEISEIANISPHSIQGQHDPYFMLQMSGGDAAKLFGELADLSIITKTTTAANRFIKDLKNEQGALAAEERRLKEEYHALSYVDEAAPLAEEVQGLLDKHTTVIALHQRLVTLQRSLATANTTLEALEGPLRGKQTLATAHEQATAVVAIQGKKHRLLQVLGAYKGNNEGLARVTAALEAMKTRVGPTITMLEDQYEKWSTLRGKITKLSRHLAGYSGLSKQIENTANGLVVATQKLEDFKLQFPTCPLCKRPMGA